MLDSLLTWRGRGEGGVCEGGVGWVTDLGEGRETRRKEKTEGADTNSAEERVMQR